MKRLLPILFLLASLGSAAQTNLWNVMYIGSKNFNQAVGKGLQVGNDSGDSLVAKGVVILDSLRGNGVGVVGIDNIGKLFWRDTSFAGSGIVYVDSIWGNVAGDTIFWSKNSITHSVPVSGGGSDYPVADSAWALLGNSGTVYGTNFIGTTDDRDLMIRVNNEKAGTIEGVGSENTGLGYQSLENDNPAIDGFYNAAFGYRTLNANTSGNSNTAIGHTALEDNVSGNRNTAIGFQSMINHQSNSDNTAIGSDALSNSTSAKENTAIGSKALESITTGELNTAIGYRSGKNVSNGISNTFIGHSAGGTSGTKRSAIALGAGALADSSYRFVVTDSILSFKFKNIPSGYNAGDKMIVEDTTTGLWYRRPIPVGVDSIWRTLGKDSIQYSIDGRYHAIKDSVGGGIGLARPPLNGVQYDSAGTFGANANLLYDYTNGRFGIGGNGVLPTQNFQVTVSSKNVNNQHSLFTSADAYNYLGVKSSGLDITWGINDGLDAPFYAINNVTSKYPFIFSNSTDGNGALAVGVGSSGRAYQNSHMLELFPRGNNGSQIALNSARISGGAWSIAVNGSGSSQGAANTIAFVNMSQGISTGQSVLFDTTGILAGRRAQSDPQNKANAVLHARNYFTTDTLLIVEDSAGVNAMNITGDRGIYLPTLTTGSSSDSSVVWNPTTKKLGFYVKPGGSGGGGSGTVTNFSFTNANGFTGVVTNATTTPNLTLSGKVDTIYRTIGIDSIFFKINGTTYAISDSSSAAWSLTGNAGTTPITNFLGTTDNNALVIKTNDTTRAIFSATNSNARIFQVKSAASKRK